MVSPDLLNEAEETLTDARKMLEGGISARSVVNRAYYAMFYGVIALLIHENIEHKTSKHSGIISITELLNGFYPVSAFYRVERK